MPNRICLITGIGGLIGSQCADYFRDKFDEIIGIDCDARREFFGDNASVLDSIRDKIDKGDSVYSTDITNRNKINQIFEYHGQEIDFIIHTAAQPSHDWAASNPHRDFEVNALGTLNLLEAYRKYCPEATFIFTSTNKVYGDRPNGIHLIETDTRYELNKTGKYKYQVNPNAYENGFPESLSIDNSTHSLFGVSKAYADLAVQEYGKYFGLNTGVFRGGCLTGPSHRGAQLHGFLSYLLKCIVHEQEYTIFGNGKQVRDNIHAYDVATAFHEFYKNPNPGEVYNIGGGRHSNCSILEAIDIIEKKTGKKANIKFEPNMRKGDHIWYITDMSKFKKDYPNWNYKYNLEQIIDEMIQSA